MPDYILKWAIEALLKFLSGYITPQLFDKFKAAAVAQMRKMAKDQTPDFPFDDQLVELIAKALGVP